MKYNHSLTLRALIVHDTEWGWSYFQTTPLSSADWETIGDAFLMPKDTCAINITNGLCGATHRTLSTRKKSGDQDKIQLFLPPEHDISYHKPYWKINNRKDRALAAYLLSAMTELEENKLNNDE